MQKEIQINKKFKTSIDNLRLAIYWTISSLCWQNFVFKRSNIDDFLNDYHKYLEDKYQDSYDLITAVLQKWEKEYQVISQQIWQEFWNYLLKNSYSNK